MTNYIEKNLLEGEKILFQGHRHWIVFWQPVFWLMVTVLFVTQLPGLTMLGLLPLSVTIITIIASVINYSMTEIAVTNMRVLIKVGLFTRQSLETMHENISTIYVKQSIIGRFLNYGEIIISDIGNTRTGYKAINNAFVFRKMVQEQVDSVKKEAKIPKVSVHRVRKVQAPKVSIHRVKVDVPTSEPKGTTE